MLKTTTVLRAIAFLLPAAVLICSPAAAEPVPHAESAPESRAARRVFKQYAGAVVQVRVIETTSGVKSSLGSGFFVSGSGTIVSNYHVVSSLVFHPKRYRLEILDSSSKTMPAELVYLDVVHDLAVLRTEQHPANWIAAAPLELNKGEQVYSFGNPHDLGMAIIEGIYSGFVENSRYEKIHFTGSINSGMSGGPALTEDGRLVGVNVSSMGDQVSFLVPAKFVSAMLEAYRSANSKEHPPLLSLVETQLLENQKSTYEELFAGVMPSVQLGSYRAPSKLLPSLKCWSNSKTMRERRYSYITHQCSFSDSIYLTGGFRTGSLYLFYNLISGERLNRFQFASLVENHLESYGGNEGGTEEDVTNFRCVQDFVETNGSTVWVNTCYRAYRQMPSLYDVAVVTASVNTGNRSLLSYVRAKGVSFPNAQKLVKTVLSEMAWQKAS